MRISWEMRTMQDIFGGGSALSSGSYFIINYFQSLTQHFLHPCVKRFTERNFDRLIRNTNMSRSDKGMEVLVETPSNWIGQSTSQNRHG